MPTGDIISAVQPLSRGEKFHLAHLLLEELAKEEDPAIFKEGQVYPIYTPEYTPQAAAQLATLLREDRTHSRAASSNFPTAIATRVKPTL